MSYKLNSLTGRDLAVGEKSPVASHLGVSVGLSGQLALFQPLGFGFLADAAPTSIQPILRADPKLPIAIKPSSG